MPRSKFYEVTDLDALQQFSKKAVTLVPRYNNGLILRLLRDCDVVPGVKRIGSNEEIAQEAKKSGEAA